MTSSAAVGSGITLLILQDQITERFTLKRTKNYYYEVVFLSACENLCVSFVIELQTIA